MLLKTNYADRYCLDNGLNILVRERPSLPIVTTMLWYKIGGCHIAGKTGIAHFLEHLMFKGTKKLKKGEIDRITQRLGGTNNAFTSADSTCYYFNFPANHWSMALQIEADRMVNCRWTKKEFDSEKSVIMEEIAASLDSPLEVISQEAETMCYQRHPYRYPILGWKDDLAKITLPEIREFYRKYYSPNNAVLVVVGDVKKQQVFEQAQKFFGKIDAGDNISEINIEEPEPLGQKRLSYCGQVTVPRFCFVFPTCPAHHFDDCVLDLIDILLSAGRSSRFYRELMQERSVMQNIVTFNNTRKYQGLFWIQGELTQGIEPTSAEELINYLIRKLHTVNLGKYELQKAKNIYLANFLFEEESNYDLAGKIGKYEVLTGMEKLSQIPKIIQGITVEDIKKVASRYLNWDRSTIAWSLPKKAKNYSKTKLEKKSIASLRGMKIPQKAKPFGPHYLDGKALTFSLNEKLPIHHYTLENGLTILVLKNPKLPMIAMELYCRRIFDEPGKEGTGLLTGRLLQEGSKKYSEHRISHLVDFLGADYSTHSYGICARFLKKDWKEIVELMVDTIESPLFNTEALAREKKKIENQILTQRDNPYFLGKTTFQSIIYKKHPYGAPVQGTLSSLKKITRKDIVEYFNNRFVANNSILAIAGDVEPEEIFREIKKYFGNWQAKKLVTTKYPLLRRAKNSITRHIPLDKKQMVVYWGHLGVKRNNPDYYKLRVLDQILGEGAGFTDRLSKKIRDELGLCYSIDASTTVHAGREPGLCVVSFSTTPENYKKAIDHLVKEINHLKKYPATEEELDNAKKFLTNGLYFALEENENLAGLMIRIHLHKLGFDYIKKAVDEINNTTLQDIRSAARRYLQPEVATTIVVGPVEQL